MSRAAQPLSDRWFFYQDEANRWKWARLDVLGTVLAQAEQAFDSREACVSDARQSGYETLPHAAPPVKPLRRCADDRSGHRTTRGL
jgi:hypothetical protein